MSEKTRVLLVEDDDQSAGDYLRWLNDAGHQVQRVATRSEAIATEATMKPDVVLLDMQIPSEPGAADEHVDHGLAVLDALIERDPFRPIVIITAHSRNRDLMRRALQRTRGGQFVFKDSEDLERELLDAIAVAAASPAYRTIRTVREFRDLVDQELKEDEYRKFLGKHWHALLGPEYRECHAPYEISRGAEIDILAIRHDGFPDLYELKKPSDPFLTPYNQWKHQSTQCARAVGQLIQYLDLAGKEPIRPDNYDARRGISLHLHRPRGVVVIGRYSQDEKQREQERDRLRLENRYLSGLAILTYDDLIERAEQYVHFLHAHRDGD